MTNEWSNLDERYFKWLYSLVEHEDSRDPSRSFLTLCEVMHRKPFTWLVDFDDNRAEYGKDLRTIFLDETDLDADNKWLEMECSIFEMLVALAEEAAFQTEDNPHNWFWIFINNLGLNEYSDDVYNDSVHSSVVATLRRFIYREYKPDGRGGLFPLRNPKEDQREVELWYQLSAYLIENSDF